MKQTKHILLFNEFLSDSKEKKTHEAKQLKERLLFDCRFKVVFGKEEEIRGNPLSEILSQEPVGRYNFTRLQMRIKICYIDKKNQKITLVQTVW